MDEDPWSHCSVGRRPLEPLLRWMKTVRCPASHPSKFNPRIHQLLHRREGVGRVGRPPRAQLSPGKVGPLGETIKHGEHPTSATPTTEQSERDSLGDASIAEDTSLKPPRELRRWIKSQASSPQAPQSRVFSTAPWPLDRRLLHEIPLPREGGRFPNGTHDLSQGVWASRPG